MKIQGFLLFIGLSFWGPRNNGQDTIESKHNLIENIKVLRSIDPYDTNYEDLVFLDEELDDAEIVMLGEQTHGDGSTFLAKTRMIKYLHEHLGYNILVFESGLMDAYRVWEMIKLGADSVEVFDFGIFPVWSGSEQVQPLFQYILEQARTDNPLILAGFDIQPTGSSLEPNARWKEIKAYLST